MINTRAKLMILLVLSLLFAMAITIASIYVLVSRVQQNPNDFEVSGVGIHRGSDEEHRIFEEFKKDWNSSKTIILICCSIVLVSALIQLIAALFFLYQTKDNCINRNGKLLPLNFWMFINGLALIAILICLIINAFYDPTKGKVSTEKGTENVMIRSKSPDMSKPEIGLITFLQQGLNMYNSLLGADIGFLFFSMILMSCYKRRFEDKNQSNKPQQIEIEEIETPHPSSLNERS